MIFEHIAIIGIGLIGSSIAHGVREGNLSKTICASDMSEDVCERAKKLSIFDTVSSNLKEIIPNADLIILCTPVGSMESVAEKIQPFLKQGAVITDVGSVKQSVIKSVLPFIPQGCHFIPAHPIAGTEHSGPEAGFAQLFQGRWHIITPLPDSDPEMVEKLSAFWSALGAKVDEMTPQRHDLVLAITSHLPHLIAYNIVGTAAHLEQVSASEVIKYSASGFRDFTRLAASDPIMWRDIFLNNRDAVIEMLGRFIEDLIDVQRAIRYEDGEKLFNLFTKTRQIRREIIGAGQDTAAPDFGRQLHLSPSSQKK
jgi:cyclohexadieny/prephenate dehydrogenase